MCWYTGFAQDYPPSFFRNSVASYKSRLKLKIEGGSKRKICGSYVVSLPNWTPIVNHFDLYLICISPLILELEMTIFMVCTYGLDETTSDWLIQKPKLIVVLKVGTIGHMMISSVCGGGVCVCWTSIIFHPKVMFLPISFITSHNDQLSNFDKS